MMKFNKDFFKYFSLLGSLGFTIIGNMLIFVSVYKYIISKYILDSPILFIIFILLGVISGFYNIYREIMKK